MALTFFHSFGMIALALETGTPCNSFFVFRMCFQNSLYTVFFGGTSGLGVFKSFTLKTLHTLSAFLNEVPFVLFSSGKFPKRIKKFLHVHFLSMKNN